LKRYLCEFDFRYNERSAVGVEDSERTTKALRGKAADVPGLVSPGRLIRTGVMSRIVKLSVKARGETDSPRVDDFLDQVRDYFEILDGVEQALADGTNAIVWRAGR
jgi:hypothetical protein